MRKKNLIAACVLIALGIAYGVLTGNLPTRNIESATGPSFFPWIITICLVGLACILLVQGLLSAVSDKPPSGEKLSRTRCIAGLVTAIVYLLALPTLGFIAANIPLIAVLMVLYGERRPVWVIGGSIAISVAAFFLFRDAFQIRLPAGILEALVS
jgi:hypothetical protein